MDAKGNIMKNYPNLCFTEDMNSAEILKFYMTWSRDC